MSTDQTLAALCLLTTILPGTLVARLTVGFLAEDPPPEQRTAALVLGSLAAAALATIGIAWLWWIDPRETIVVELGQWFGTHDYGFDIVYQIDSLTVSVLPIVALVTLTVARFAVPYMHREQGFTRFFLQLCLFASGIFLVVLAGSADLLLVGWECIGIASALLVTFFHERAAPPRAATHVFTTYRLCDVGLLVGIMSLHIFGGTAEFSRLFGDGAWPSHSSTLQGTPAEFIAAALITAACGKSAQFPLGTWLPRAMEGPTPSSALFYGGPAVHAGVFLLLRCAPLIEQTTWVSALLVGIGSVTALHATIVCRVQCDQKSTLAYATMTQLGLMVAECGLGLWTLARIHMLSHICLRTYQLLRAPSALRDAHTVRATNRGEPIVAAEFAPRFVPPPLLRWAYHLGLERTHIDTLIERWMLHPILRLGARADNLERRAFARLAGPAGMWGESSEESGIEDDSEGAAL